MNGGGYGGEGLYDPGCGRGFGGGRSSAAWRAETGLGGGEASMSQQLSGSGYGSPQGSDRSMSNGMEYGGPRARGES